MEDFRDSSDGEFWFSATDWAKLLHLATLYGYDPSDLGPREPLTRVEVAVIASAIEESLDDIPNHNATGGKRASEMSPFEWFSGPRKEKLIEFIHFCKESRILGD